MAIKIHTNPHQNIVKVVNEVPGCWVVLVNDQKYSAAKTRKSAKAMVRIIKESIFKTGRLPG